MIGKVKVSVKNLVMEFSKTVSGGGLSNLFHNFFKEKKTFHKKIKDAQTPLSHPKNIRGGSGTRVSFYSQLPTGKISKSIIIRQVLFSLSFVALLA